MTYKKITLSILTQYKKDCKAKNVKGCGNAIINIE